MARTVDTPIILPRQWAAGGAEIIHASQSSDFGLQYVARAQNTMFDQHRSNLVSDHEADSEATILAATAANNLRYRVKTEWFQSTTETITVGMYAFGNGGAGAGVVTVSDGTNSTTLAAPTGSASTVFAATSTMTIVTSGSNADLTWTYTSGTVGAVVGTFAYWNRTRATLPTAGSSQYYTGTTFCPQDDSLYADNFPVTSAMGFALRDNADHLYTRTGQAVSCSWGNSALGSSSPVGFVRPVPENVTTLRLFVDGVRVTTGGYQIDTQREQKTGSFTATRAFTSAVDLDVEDLGIVEVQLVATGDGSTYGLSGYWLDRSLPT